MSCSLKNIFNPNHGPDQQEINMKRSLSILLLSLLALLGMVGCTPLTDPEPGLVETEVVGTPMTTREIETTLPSLTPQPSMTPTRSLAELEGPLLLIQTGLFDYQFLSPKSQISIAVDLPVTDPQFRLSANISPSRTQVFIPQDDNTGAIIDLKTNEVISVYDFSGPTIFQSELAALEARAYFSEEDFSDGALLNAILQAHQQSKQIIRWYYSDRYHLSVQDTDEASTSLFLDDHHTGVRIRLDDQPGLVKDFRVGPDNNQILLEKGFVFEPGAWQDNSYYLINVEDQTTQLVPLPKGAENPSVSWFAEDAVGVIHDPFFRGGSGFSIIDLRTMESFQIIEDDFTHLRRFKDDLFLIRWDFTAGITLLELRTLEGEPVASQAITAACNFHTSISNRIILNCENESLKVNTNLDIQPFGDPVFVLSPAPDGSAIVLISRSALSYLLDAEMQPQYQLELEAEPLEIRWLPDSSGFLYRTRGRLHHYDLNSKTSRSLFQSDLFTDYMNINAVWINLD